MSGRITKVLTSAFILAMVVGPAMAGTIVPSALPEPVSMTLFGVGVAGAYIAKRIAGRK